MLTWCICRRLPSPHRTLRRGAGMGGGVIQGFFGGCGPPCGSSSFIELADLFFHFLPRFERDDELFSDVDSISGSGVSGLPGGSFFDLKNAEIPQFNPSVFHQRLDDGVEGLL